MLTVNPQSAVPVYEQIRSQITQQVEHGELPAGSQLPTVRRLAADLGLAPNTVARAYRELEQDGVVATARRRGTIVADQQVDVPAEARRETADFVARLNHLGLSPSDTIRLVRATVDELTASDPRQTRQPQVSGRPNRPR